MDYKKFFFIFLLYFNIGNSNIIYDKNNVLISDIELDTYINVYKEFYSKDLENNKALKEIVLLKKTVNFLLNYNPEFMEKLDQNIKLEYGNDISKDQILFNFIRFKKIRNEFVSEYFQSNFNINDLEIIFSSLPKLKLPVSKNNCLTIENIVELKEDLFFISNFYESIKKNTNIFQTKIEGEIYDVCMDNKTFKQIEEVIIKYIESKTDEEFNKFIYGKVN